jgi:hypothetical protein
MEPSRRGKNTVFRAQAARFISRRPRISSAFRSRVFSQFVNAFPDSLPTFELLLVQILIPNGGERRQLDKAEHSFIYARDVHMSRYVNA